MKLIFVLILIVGIAAWYFKPSRPQDASSNNQTTVQTNNTTSSPNSTGKAIWDGKLTVDDNTADELLERPHNELSAEEVALKWEVSMEYAKKTKDWTKHLECLTDQARQRTVNEIKKIDYSELGVSDVIITYSVVKSIVRGNSAKVMFVAYNSLQPIKKNGGRLGYIINLYKTKRGWVADMPLDELTTERPIKIHGKYYGRFRFSVRPEGTIGIAIPITIDSQTGKRRSSPTVDLSDQHIRVDELMESLMK